MKVWWIDLEDNPYGMVERLIDFGVEKAVVLKCLRYVNPSSKLTPKSAREFYDAVAEDEPSLIVVDSAGEWGGLQGVKANIDEEIAQFGKAYIAPLARTGAAVVTIDHVGHEQKDPLRAAGSFRKMAAINGARSEEHTSELQTRENLVCRLLLEKKRMYPRIGYNSKNLTVITS